MSLLPVNLTSNEWYELKTICGAVFKFVKDDQPLPDFLHFGLLQLLKLPPETVCDYLLFGNIQFKMITLECTLLYNDSVEIDKRQIFIYETPARHKAYI